MSEGPVQCSWILCNRFAKQLCLLWAFDIHHVVCYRKSLHHASQIKWCYSDYGSALYLLEEQKNLNSLAENDTTPSVIQWTKVTAPSLSSKQILYIPFYQYLPTLSLDFGFRSFVRQIKAKMESYSTPFLLGRNSNITFFWATEKLIAPPPFLLPASGKLQIVYKSLQPKFVAKGTLGFHI